MRFHGQVAALLGFFMLRLTIVGGGMACPTGAHADHAAHGAAAAHVAGANDSIANVGMASMPDMATPDHSSSDDPPAVPAQPRCCEAVASCLVMVFASGSADESAIETRSRDPHPQWTLPLDHTVSPEPPPPRV